jgi:hypothetical protein
MDEVVETQATLYGGTLLQWQRATKNMNVYSAFVDGRKQTQYVPKSDMVQMPYIRVIAQGVTIPSEQ